MARLNTFVHVRDDEGLDHAFGPSDVVPAWAQEKITNPDVWASEGVEPAAATAVPTEKDQKPSTEGSGTPGPVPPKSGKGSGVAAWKTYATDKGFEFDDDVTREEIIAALEADGIPTE